MKTQILQIISLNVQLSLKSLIMYCKHFHEHPIVTDVSIDTFLFAYVNAVKELPYLMKIQSKTKRKTIPQISINKGSNA